MDVRFMPWWFAAALVTLVLSAPSRGEINPIGEPSGGGPDAKAKAAVVEATVPVVDSALIAWEARLGQSDAVNEIAGVCRGVAPSPLASCALIVSVGQWCGCYAGPAAKVRDLTTILSERPLRAAYFLTQPTLVEQPLTQLERLLKGTLPPADAALPGLGGLTKALGSVNATQNSAAAAAVTGLLPSMDVNALVQRAFEGLALALKERAEQEAAYYVLLQLEEKLCQSDDGKTYLKATCAVAESFKSTATGVVALGLLRRSVETDFRRLPSVLIETRGATLGIGAPSRELVEAIIGGENPARALERFSRDVHSAAASSSSGHSAQLQPLACGASVPASLLRNGTLLDDAGGSLPLSSADRSVALTLMALAGSACSPLVAGRHPIALDGLVNHYTKIAEAGASLGEIERALRALAKPLPQTSSGDEALSPEEHARRRAVAAAQRIDEGIAATLDALAASLQFIEVVDSSRDLAQARETLRQVRSWRGIVLDAVNADLNGLWSKLVLEAGTSLPEPIKTYGGLLVAVGSAKTSEEVKDAVLAAAAPLGLWRDRYVKGSSLVTVGGSVGLGLQFAKVAASGESTRHSQRGWSKVDHRPLAVPFGLDVKLGTPIEEWLSISAFVQVLDVAGWLNLPDGTEAPRPLQGLSPGVALKLGLLGSPVSLAIGASWDMDTGAAEHDSGWRSSIMIAVDAPLFVVMRR